MNLGGLLLKLRRSRVVWSLFAGAGFALAAPPVNLYPALWLGMAAFAWALSSPPADGATRGGAGPTDGRKPRKVRRFVRRVFDGGARGLAFGVGANVVALGFVPAVIARFTPLPWIVGVVALVLLAAFEALRFVVAAMVCRAFTRLGAPSWAAFAAGIFAGTFVPTVFPWSAAGGVTPWPAMVQLADVIGERGVTALMALTAGLLAAGVRARSVRHLAVAVALPLATLGYGALRIRAVDAWELGAPRVTVAVVQPSIGATERWDPERASSILAKLTTLTKQAEARGAALTIWHEAAFPYPVAHASRRGPIGPRAILGAGVHGPVLTGLVLRGGKDDTYNASVIAFTDGTISEPQDKLHLLWFGETVPFADRFPWLRETFARGTGLSPGDHVVVERTGEIRAVVLNCFEDTLPDAGREMVRGAIAETGSPPNLLVNVTNDAWFVDSPESELHLRLAALRAVEERRDLVRAVNFGPTTWVDAAGRVRARLEPPLAGPLLAAPALLEGGPTIYARAGDMPLVLVMLFGAICGVVRGAIAKRAVAKRAKGGAGRPGRPTRRGSQTETTGSDP